jgi:hypothetical protein
MNVAMLTRQVSMAQMFYEMNSEKQNRGVHHLSKNKGKHKEEKKIKEWKDKKKKDKDK